jgi:hypothetical protein
MIWNNRRWKSSPISYVQTPSAEEDKEIKALLGYKEQDDFEIVSKGGGGQGEGNFTRKNYTNQIGQNGKKSGKFLSPPPPNTSLW